MRLFVHVHYYDSVMPYYNIIGPLGQVTNLRRNYSGHPGSAVYTWNPPFSLNVTNAEPDIAYCVHIYNVTCLMQKRITLLENCTVTTPNFSLRKGLSAEEIYEIEVSARINLDMALQNRTSSAKYRGIHHYILIYSMIKSVASVKILIWIYYR